MKITRPMMASCYELLRIMQPFKDWNLPHESHVRFKHIHAKTFYGDYWKYGQKPRIRTTSLIKTLAQFIETMAHEMTHMKEGINGRDEGKEHGPEFIRLARQVCKELGFKYKKF